MRGLTLAKTGLFTARVILVHPTRNDALGSQRNRMDVPGMARPQVGDRGTASDTEGSCEEIE